jgi:adhesin transport system outer membrane protein
MDIHPDMVSLMIKRSLVITLMASATLLPFRFAVAETLTESVQQALAMHPSVEAAQAGQDIAEQNRREARSNLFPELSANVSAGRIFSDTSTTRGLSVSRGAAYSWLGEGSASITQPLFDGHETFNRIDAAQARSQTADHNVTDVRENLAFQATQAHLAVMQAQATLNKTQSYYKVIESYLERIQMMVDEGAADQSEMAQAQNISLMLKSALIDYQGQLDAAYASYQEIVGNRPKGDLIKPSMDSVEVLSDVTDAVQFAKNNHPVIRAGEAELIAAGYDVKAEKAGYYPDLGGEMSYLKKDQREEIGGEVIDARALLRMTWDFEVGGAQKARTRKSKAQYSEILAQNREKIRTIEGDVRRSYAEYKTAKKQFDLVKAREEVTQELFEAYEVQFEGARVRLLQLMQAENQSFNAQLESITAEYRYLLSEYGVLASLGQLLGRIQSSVTLPSIGTSASSEKIILETKVSAQKLQEVPESISERIHTSSSK